MREKMERPQSAWWYIAGGVGVGVALGLLSAPRVLGGLPPEDIKRDVQDPAPEARP